MGHETVGGDVQHHFLGILFLYLNAYGLCQMCLSQTGASVYKKRIVRGVSGILGNRQSGRAAETVAVSFNEILKRVIVVEIGIDSYALDAWNHIRVIDFLHLFLGQGDVGIDDSGVRSAGRIAYSGVLYNRYLIYELCILSDNPFHGGTQDVYVVGLDVFGKET